MIGHVYLFHLEQWDSTYSNRIVGPADLAQVIAFTDDPLTPGTVVKAKHITEIVSALNAIRQAVRIAPVQLDVQPGSLIQAADISLLRTWIAQTRSAAGAYAVTFTNPLAVGDPIRAIDIQELREAVR